MLDRAEIVIKEMGEVLTCKARLPASVHPEASPNIIKVGQKNHIIITTGYSALIPIKEGVSGYDLFTREDALECECSRLITDNGFGYGGAENGGSWVDSETFNADCCFSNGWPYWKRSYYGIYGAQVVTVEGKQYILCLMHGENKNEKFTDGRKYINSVQPKRAYEEHEYSGLGTNGVYDDYSEAYFAFVSLMCVPADRMHERFDTPEFDYGPVVWPYNGYIDKQSKRINSGLRHPSIFLEDDYIYIYYLDNEYIRAARAPLASLGAPGSFKMYYDGSFSEPALPEGFSKYDRRFFSIEGGKSSPIFEDSKSIRFSVAKLKGTTYYLGIEEFYTVWPQMGLRLRLSTDLVHWTEGTVIPDSFVDDYNQATLHYPVFYNEDFTSQQEIDPKSFYIVGEWGNNIGCPRIECRRFSIGIR